MLLSPVTERRLAPTGLATHFSDTRALVSLFQNKRNPRLTKLRRFHGTLLPPERDLNWKNPGQIGPTYWERIVTKPSPMDGLRAAWL